MEQRGRSPSQGNRSRGPSPHPYQDHVTGVDPRVQQELTAGKFNTSPHFNDPFQYQQPYNQPQPSFSQPQETFNQAAYHDNQLQYNQEYMYQQMQQHDMSQHGLPQHDMSQHGLPQEYSYGLDPGYNVNQQSNVNPADLSKVSTPQDHQSPNLLSPENHPLSQPGSPASTNGQYYTPQHSRHTSLDPAAAYGDYTGNNFQQHRRAPSDHSDAVSSASHSPYLAQAELEPVDSHSPYLAAQQDTSNTFGMDSFSIGDNTYRSPRLMPSMEGQGLGVQQEMPQPEIYAPQAIPAHMRNQSIVSELGQADQFAPPTINIEPAPVSRVSSFGPQGEHYEGALSPPGSSGKL